MIIDELIVEITRRCNMNCKHCLRGYAQNKDMDYNTMVKILTNIDSIGLVIFTGGEPSLNVQGLKDFLRLCKDKSIPIGSFYIATNGTNSEDFIDVIFDLYNYCLDKKSSHIDISRSHYHYEQDEEMIKKLKCLSFVKERKEYFSPLKREGKSLKGKPVEIIPLELEDNIVKGNVYLNVNGDICSSCDLSYESQDKYKIGNIHRQTLQNILVEGENYEQFSN